MRESYKEDLANHFELEEYADCGNVMGVATTEVHAYGGTADTARTQPLAA